MLIRSFRISGFRAYCIGRPTTGEWVMAGRRKYHTGLSVLICSYGVSFCISRVRRAYIIRLAGTGVFVIWDQGWHQFFLLRAGRSLVGSRMDLV
jgi:hypothetical protein